jgi:hypothetical protein
MASPQIVTIEFKDQDLILYDYVDSTVLESGDPGKASTFPCHVNVQ